MEHEEPGIASPAPLKTVDTNAPGQGHTIRGARPRTLWAGEPVEVNPEPYREPLEDLYREVEITEPSTSITFLTKNNGDYIFPAEAPTKIREGDQPLPEVNDTGFIQDLVIEDIEARKAVGISRYGTPLQPFNGRNVDQDLYEELIDATVYLRQRLVERVALNETVSGLTRLLEATFGELPSEVWDYLGVLFTGTNG
jgi:hypothetical protein